MHTPKSPKSTKPVKGPQGPSTVSTHTNPYQSALESLAEEVSALSRGIETDFTHLMQKVAKYRKSKRRKDEMGFKEEEWYVDAKEDLRVRSIELKHLELKLITLKDRSNNGI